MGELRLIHSNGDRPNELRNFLNKPAHETTVGDTLLIQTATVLIHILVPKMVQGLEILLSQSPFKKRIR